MPMNQAIIAMARHPNRACCGDPNNRFGLFLAEFSHSTGWALMRWI